MAEKVKLYCGCKAEFYENELSEEFQRFSGGVIHIRGSCPSCGRYKKYVPYSKSKVCSFILKEIYRAKTSGDYSEINMMIDSLKIYGEEQNGYFRVKRNNL